MEGGSNRGSSKASSGGDEAAAAVGGGEDSAAAAAEEAAVSPPAPAASPRPYYECVFCKRGFTTAQALGGHMNIHRRDRAKPAARDLPTGITTVSRNVECYNKYRHLVSYPPAPSTLIPTGAAAGASGSSFAMIYGSTAAAAGMDAERVSPSSSSPRELSLFGAATRDQDLHLGLGRHGRAGDGSHTPERSEHQAPEQERELDLELRLGRRPRH